MKKLIASALAASMLISTPAFAEHQDRDHSGWSKKEHRHDNPRKRNGCGWLCGAIIGGIVVGAISSEDRDYRDRDYDNRYYPPDYRYDRRYCVREQVTEWYRGERYIYWETRCN